MLGFVFSIYSRSYNGLQAEAVFASLVRSLHQGRVLDSSGEYQVVPNLAPGTRQPAPRFSSTIPDIALVSQCSFNHLHHLVPMVQRWQVGLKTFMGNNRKFEYRFKSKLKINFPTLN
jgi:hypothetical protein